MQMMMQMIMLVQTMMQATSDGDIRDIRTRGFQRLGLDVFLILKH